MKKKALQIIVSALLIFIIGSCAVGQSNPKILSSLLNSPKMLITNQDIFLPGEYLHFRLFGNSITSPRTVTMYLLDTDHNVKFQQEVKINGNVISGNIRLPSYLNKSKYHLLCVDNIENIYGIKEMWITSPKEKKVDFNARFEKESYSLNEMVKVSLKFSTDDIMGIKGGKGKYTLNSTNNVLYKGKFKIDDNSTAEIEFKNQYEGFAYIEIEFKYGKDKYLFHEEIPNQKKEIKVSLRPEGGNIIAGVNNKIAIRTLSLSNIPTSINGVLKDDQNNEIAEVVLNKSGHGVFEFIPDQNKTYYIEFPSNKVLNSKVKLPELSKKATISLSDIKNTAIEVNINTNNAFEGTIIAINNNKIFFTKALSLTNSVSESLPITSNNDGLVSIFLLNKEGQIISNRKVLLGKILAPNLTVDNFSYNTESIIEASVLDNTSHIGERTLTFNSVQKNRVSRTIPWNFYCLDYCFDNLTLNQLNTTKFSDLSSLLKLKYSLSAYLKNSVCLNDYTNDFVNIEGDIILNIVKSNKHIYNLSSITPELKDKYLGGLIYSDNTKEILKEKKPEKYQELLASGVSLEKVLYSIKPFTYSNGQILFNGIKSSINSQQGALIYIDGIQTSIATTGIDPSRIAEIKVLTEPSETLAYTAFATMGIIDIRTKKGNEEELSNDAKSKLNGEYKSNLYWNAQLPFRPKTNSRIAFSSSKLQDDFIVYIFDQKSNNLPIFNVRSFEVVGNN